MTMLEIFGLESVMRGSFYVLLFIFLIYTLFLGYHWFTYGLQRRTSMVALATYMLGGAACFIVMSAAL